MKRLESAPRDGWAKIVEKQGFHFHSTPAVYWDESAYYELTSRQVDVLEAATNQLHQMSLAAVDHVIAHDMFDVFQIPRSCVSYVIDSWNNEEPTIYGRFDLSYDGANPPRLLEYNADTPTSLLEASVIQWYWLQDTHPEADQFNSIHEKLIARWKDAGIENDLYFASVDESVEDFMTVSYLRDTAMQAGLKTDYIAIEKLGWDHERRIFVDVAGKPIRNLFKLYPWEFLFREPFGRNILFRKTRWIEPAWKMILSNKAILPVLWEMYPDHPNLLRAEFEPFGSTYVRKPMLAREGANIQIVFDGKEFIHTDGDYGPPYIYQEVCPLPRFDGKFACVGSWVVDDTACGIGIRESDELVTRNTSRFLPHLF
jgi:glutathionylspermidine synthase